MADYDKTWLRTAGALNIVYGVCAVIFAVFVVWMVVLVLTG